MQSGKVFFWTICCAIAVGLSKGFEAMGDSAFNGGDSGSALLFHLLALAFLLGAIACGINFFRALFRANSIGGGEKTAARRIAQVFEDSPPAGDAFDPDAALGNYMAKREHLPPSWTEPQAPRQTGFGKRGL